MAGQIFLLLLGLVFLVGGGQWFVDGAAALARLFKVRPLIIGIVVIGFGTSTPELLVTLFAVGDGKGKLAIGNLVGSNIANIGLILALSAVIFPLVVSNSILRKELPLTIVITLLFGSLVMLGGRLDPLGGLILLVAFAGIFIFLLAGGQRAEDRAATQIIIENEGVAHPPRRIVAVGQTLIGLVLILLGANFTVDSASFIARELGIGEAIIGLTIVALGTSLPELVAAIIASCKRQSELIVGNVLGSNIYNLGFTAGIAAAISGKEGLPIDDSLRFVSTGFMLLITLVLVPLLFRGLKLDRVEGVLCLGAYSAYLYILF